MFDRDPLRRVSPRGLKRRPGWWRRAWGRLAPTAGPGVLLMVILLLLCNLTGHCYGYGREYDSTSEKPKCHLKKYNITGEPPDCQDTREVCKSILKVGQTVTIQEAELCSCRDKSLCEGCWRVDEASVTWYHHQRMDWQVQYRFCVPVMAIAPVCSTLKEDDNAAQIQVNHDHWDPRIIGVRCHCPDYIYHLKSWFRIEYHEEHEKPISKWDYTYTCNMPLCKKETTPCARHYLDRSGSHTNGYVFLCSCPASTFCPTGRRGKVNAYDMEGIDKEVGSYMLDYCLPVPGWGAEVHH